MALYFDTNIQYVKGVGPKLGEVLRRRGIGTVGELLEWYPRAYEDRRAARNIAGLKPNETVSLRAQIINVKSIPLGRSSRRIYDITVGDESGRIHCKFFRTPYRGYFEKWSSGMSVRIVGKVILYRGQLEFHHPDLHSEEEGEDHSQEEHDQLIPLYTETEGLSPSKIRKIIKLACDEIETTETLPKWICEKYKLVSRLEALRALHCPPETAGPDYLNGTSPFHRRLIFEEFFWLEIAMALRRHQVVREKGSALEIDVARLDPLLQSLPFRPTGAQMRALDEIIADLRKPHPMLRMVQGDVGSGKTLVAMMALLLVVEAGFQGALMAPTEILAEQHHRNLSLWLKPLGIQVGILTGSTKAKERRELLEKLSRGEVHILVGTHALIEDAVDFQKLALVIIDEQHRFGVEQRHRLKRKGVNPHFLVMTATPIPRTLAMTVYGDLEVSILDELPPGRMPIQTRVAYESKRLQVEQFVEQQLDRGRQVYVVYPLVEESEKIEMKNAVEEAEKWRARFPNYKVGLLHGRMSAEEKDSIMQEFRQNHIQVLVSTTVIEVGVDVPNANLILIEHAERFGLSQLHQLRGRVGRGEHKSFCILMLGFAVSEESRERVTFMESTTDGFKVAEKDLEIRGPGEFMGTRQSGLPGFRLANLVRDAAILKQAREAAFEVLHRDPTLRTAEHEGLRRALMAEKRTAELIEVG